ncbi:hypothetical protein M3Y98_00901900 [Aphelenchoides besseyi]|nr:hypothetical protein M3Y98_00901900 [Aphelenchoides besseyi]
MEDPWRRFSLWTTRDDWALLDSVVVIRQLMEKQKCKELEDLRLNERIVTDCWLSIFRYPFDVWFHDQTFFEYVCFVHKKLQNYLNEQRTFPTNRSFPWLTKLPTELVMTVLHKLTVSTDDKHKLLLCARSRPELSSLLHLRSVNSQMMKIVDAYIRRSILLKKSVHVKIAESKDNPFRLKLETPDELLSNPVVLDAIKVVDKWAENHGHTTKLPIKEHSNK